MIIDEILDTIELNKKIDIEYIQEQAEQFEFIDILEAIEQKDTTALKTALKNYIIQNKLQRHFTRILQRH